MAKANCYKCKYRGSVLGDAHSSCKYPGNATGMLDFFNAQNGKNLKKLNIKGNQYGMLKGWFMWPVNFDPVWLENCDGFEPEESEPSGD